MATKTGGFNAAALLEKYGWSQGKGLGKELQGRPNIVHMSQKQDSTGVGGGYAVFDFNHWDQIYNSAIKKLQISPCDDKSVTIEKKEQNETKSSLIYQGSFVSGIQPSSDQSNLCYSDLYEICGKRSSKVKQAGKEQRLQNFDQKINKKTPSTSTFKVDCKKDNNNQDLKVEQTNFEKTSEKKKKDKKRKKKKSDVVDEKKDNLEPTKQSTKKKKRKRDIDDDPNSSIVEQVESKKKRKKQN